jgi:hypothetical protein
MEPLSQLASHPNLIRRQALSDLFFEFLNVAAGSRDPIGQFMSQLPARLAVSSRFELPFKQVLGGCKYHK